MQSLTNSAAPASVIRAQMELIPPATAPKIWAPAADVRPLPYRLLPSGKPSGGKTRVASVELYDGALIYITKQSPGQAGNPRYYAKLPGEKHIIQERHFFTVLAQVALLDHIRSLNKLKDDAERLLADVTDQGREADKAYVAGLVSQLESASRRCDQLEAKNTQLQAEIAAVVGQDGQKSSVKGL